MNKGQSLIEVLIGVVIGTIFVIVVITVISPALRSQSEAARIQTASALGRELLDNVRVFAEADWHNLINLSAGASNHYYLNTSSSPFAAVAGEETVLVASSTYERYFYYDGVSRDSSGNIVTSGGVEDPSTKKVVVYFRPQNGAWRSFDSYFTRKQNKISVQSDWSAGPSGNPVVVTSTIGFATSTNITYTAIPGSIQLTGLRSNYGIDSTYRYAWSENIGWIDFYSTGTIIVDDTQLQGFASAETVGYIALDCATTPNGDICTTSNFKVLNNAGTLSGWAWNDETGWISFNCSDTSSCATSNYGVTIDSQGFFHGWAWSENIGWISFNCEDIPICTTSDYKVKTNWTP